MANVTIDGIKIDMPEGTTVLEAARFMGIRIPTLCHHDGLEPYGSCRVCLVEVMRDGGKGQLTASCTLPVQEGMVVRTETKRVMHARKMMVELLLARCPTSKPVQDLAAEMGIEKLRFTPKFEDCLLCGLCVRMCKEQMGAGAIGFIGRGKDRKVSMPFGEPSDICRECGACMYICPAAMMRCLGPGELKDSELCGACLNVNPCYFAARGFHGIAFEGPLCVECQNLKTSEKDK